MGSRRTINAKNVVLIYILLDFMMEWSAFVSVGLGFVFILLWMYTRKSEKIPPGPIGLPLIGYLPFLGKYPFKTFIKLGEKYGNVFSVPLGHQRVVVLNDWSAIKEALVNQAEIFNGRPKNKITEEYIRYLDVGFSDGPGWRERRRFVIHHLRNIGVGKSTMETVIMEEIHRICENVLVHNGQPVNVNNDSFFSFLNIIWTILAGKRFDRNSDVMEGLPQIVDAIVSEVTTTNPVLFMPYLRHIFFKKFQRFKYQIKNIDHFMGNVVNVHEKTFQNGNVRDFIDAYLIEIDKNEGNPERATHFPRESIIHVTKGIFAAAIDTSNNTLLWGLLYMATWPSIQRKVQDELDEVFGRHRLPSFADRSLLRYTNAVILEIYRYSTIVPLSLLHTTLLKCDLLGFLLPKGTIVIPNLWAVHHDPRYWKDPDVFNPERFVNAKGEVEKPEYLIPFGVGGRRCLGESLAQMTSFLFLTCLLHRFSVSLPPGVKPPSLNPIYHLTLTPEPFSLVFKCR